MDERTTEACGDCSTGRVTEARSFEPLDDDPLERRPADIRPPKTFAEAGAALEAIDDTMDAIEVAVDTRRRAGRDASELVGLMQRWAARRAMIQYDHERFPGDDPRANAKLKLQNDALSRELAAVRGQIATLSAGVLSSSASEGLRERYARSLHETLALVIHAVGEMVASGAPLTPLAAQSLQQAHATLSPKMLARWRSEVLPTKYAHANASAPVNGATGQPMALDDIDRAIRAWASETEQRRRGL